MADTVDPKYLDKRTAERYLRSGQLDEKALERHLKSLPDVADKAVPVETFMLDDVEDYDDDEDETDEVDEADDEAPAPNNDEADLAAVAADDESNTP